MPTSGLGIGMDRLMMYFNNSSIQEFYYSLKCDLRKNRLKLEEDEKLIVVLLQNNNKWNLAHKNTSGLSGKKMGQSHENLSSLGLTEVVEGDLKELSIERKLFYFKNIKRNFIMEFLFFI
jgi:lysyl-tRNA synthetase class 2